MIQREQIGAWLVARNSAINLVGQTISLVVGLAATPFIVTSLGADRFGLLSLALVTLGYFGVLDLGLGRSVTKHIAEILPSKQWGRLAAVVQTAIGIQTVSALLLATGFVALTSTLVTRILNVAPDLVYEAEAMFRVIAISLPIILVSTSLRGVLEATQSFVFLNGISVLANVVAHLGALSGAMIGLSLPSIVVLLLVPQVFVLFAYAGFVCRAFPPLTQNLLFDLSVARSLFVFGKWVMVTNVVWPLLVYLDHFIIASLLSTAAVTYYAVPRRIVAFLDRIPASIVPPLFPFLTTLGFSRIEETKRLYQTAVKLILALIGPLIIGLFVFGDRILGLVLGAEFNDSAIFPLKILAFGALAASMLHMPFTLLHALGRPDFTGKFYLVQLLIYPPFLYALIVQMGLIGAAIACAIREFVLLVVLSSACKRFFQIPLLGGTRLISVLLATAGIVGIATSVTSTLGNALTLSLGTFLFCVALFVSLLWTKTLNPREKQIIIAFIGKMPVLSKQR